MPRRRLRRRGVFSALRAFLPAALFVVSGGRDAYNLEERKAGKEISAALHAAVRAGREIKDMVDGSGYALRSRRKGTIAVEAKRFSELGGHEREEMAQGLGRFADGRGSLLHGGADLAGAHPLEHVSAGGDAESAARFGQRAHGLGAAPVAPGADRGQRHYLGGAGSRADPERLAEAGHLGLLPPAGR